MASPNGLLMEGNTATPVRVIRCNRVLVQTLTELAELSNDGSLITMLRELNENYRTYIALNFGKEYEIMVFEKFRVKILTYFDRVIANTTHLPNLNKVAVAAKDFVKLRLESFQPQLEKLFETEGYEAAVSFLVTVLKGNLNHVVIPLGGFWARLLGRIVPIDPLIDLLGSWLLANRELIGDKVGDGNPMIVNQLKSSIPTE